MNIEPCRRMNRSYPPSFVSGVTSTKKPILRNSRAQNCSNSVGFSSNAATMDATVCSDICLLRAACMLLILRFSKSLRSIGQPCARSSFTNRIILVGDGVVKISCPAYSTLLSQISAFPFRLRSRAPVFVSYRHLGNDRM